MTGMLERSLLAAVVIVGLVIVRAVLLHKLPKAAFRVMWLVVVLRLLIPFSVPVFDAPDGGGIARVIGFLVGNLQEGSVFADAGGREEGNVSGGSDGKDAGDIPGGSGSKNTGNIPDGNNSSNTGIVSNEAGTLQQNTGRLTTTNPSFPLRLPQDTEEKPDRAWPGILGDGQIKIPYTAIFCGIWLVGMFSVFLFFTISHLRARKLYSTALPVNHPLPEVDFFHPKGFKIFGGHHKKSVKGIRRDVTVKVSDRIFAPVTYGVLSPVILLPKNTDWENTEQLRMVLGHEMVHIRRFDILYKWLLAAAVALHWFNPFVFVMYILANRDIELSCDEAVIHSLAGCGKKDYALALLNYEEKRMFSPTVSGFGGNAVRERMEAIMKTNKKSVVGMAMAVILVAGTTTVFAGAKDGKKALTDGQPVLSGTQANGQEPDVKNPDSQDVDGKDSKTENPDSQNMDGKNPKTENPDSQNVDGKDSKTENPDSQDAGGKNPENQTQNSQGEDGQTKDHSKQNEKDGISTPSTVKQYICEPAYYTPEEFLEAMEQEREEIKNEVAKGFITQDGADELLADLEKEYGEVKNGRQVEKPSPVYNADGTPVVGSDGCQLYAKASDIERMNKDLRETADWLESVTSIDEYDTQVELKFIQGELFGGVPDHFKLPETDISWYDYEEYREYVEKMKEEYRSMKGEWGFNLTDGWFEWDDEKIEIACQLLDQNLEFIKNGGMISKPDEDGGVLMSGSSKFDFESASGDKWVIDEEKWVMSLEEAKEKGYDVRTAEKTSEDGGEFDGAFLKAYDAFGMTVDEKTGSYLYQGKKVAGFWDAGTVMADGIASEENGIYLKGVREDGKLVRLEEITKEEFCELSGLAM